MNKTIDKCKSICFKEIEKLGAKREEAEGNYRDTGYGRYYNKMIECDETIEELENFINGHVEEANRYKRLYHELNDRLFFVRKMVNNLTDDDFTSPRVNEILKEVARL